MIATFRRRNVLSAALASLLIFALAGCAREPVAPPSLITAQAQVKLILTDGLGRQVRLPGPAQRVVSLAPSNTEILFAIGAGSQVVGRDEFSDYPAEVSDLPSVGGSMGEYSVEAIVALEPDLVLAAEINSPELVKSLEDLSLPVFYVANPLTIEGMYANLENVAQLTGRDFEARSLITSLKSRVAAVDSRVATLTDKPMVFYEIDATDPGKPYSYGPGTFGDLLIQRAGGLNVGTRMDDPYPQVSLEHILVANPAIILLGDAQFGITIESVKERAGWRNLRAVRNDAIYPFDDNLVSRPGPRLVDGLEQMARLFHPALFP